MYMWSVGEVTGCTCGQWVRSLGVHLISGLGHWVCMWSVGEVTGCACGQWVSSLGVHVVSG